MPIINAKVYNDGSFPIAIPPNLNPPPKRKGKAKEYLAKISLPISEDENTPPSKEEKEIAKYAKNRAEKGGNEKIVTVDLKEIFNDLYDKFADKKKKEKKQEIINGLRAYIQDERELKAFVESQLERKLRNYIVKMTRLYRKVYNNDFNYFCTFTYDDKKHSEESFMKSLKNCLKHLSNRKGWKYIGVFERSPEKKRLHFHGIFHIPENAMIGELFEKKDYSLKSHKMQKTIQNTHFNEKFGRCDFEEITHVEVLKSSIKYILKYIKKSGEKLLISKNTKTYKVYDILDDDILCPYGQEGRKVLLFQDHACFVEGEYIGQYKNPETKNRLPTCN